MVENMQFYFEAGALFYFGAGSPFFFGVRSDGPAAHMGARGCYRGGDTWSKTRASPFWGRVGAGLLAPREAPNLRFRVRRGGHASRWAGVGDGAVSSKSLGATLN